VVNIRGDIYSVVDLHRFFGLPDAGGKPESGLVSAYLVVVETAEIDLALLVDEVLGVETISANRVKKSNDTAQGIPPEYVQGIIQNVERDPLKTSTNPELVIVLNISAILADKRLLIHEEII
jgi:chemotaxis signal transduction protein